MGYLVFSDEWNRAFADQINQNEAYRKAAADWEWPLVMMLEPENTGVWLDLYRGKCRSARAISAADWEVADYAISTNLAQWQQILSGERDPIMALMRGKLNLRRGKLLKLARYGSAAKQLVASAAKIPTVFPGEATGNSIEILSPKSVANQNVKIYVTTSPAGLDQDSFPMKLYHKAKKLGIWNPQDIDFSEDIIQWQSFNPTEKEVLLHLSALFQAGEESVTRDLLPLMMVIAKEGRIEEEMFLTTFLWEEAKHTEFFRRFLDEVARDNSDLSRFHTQNYRNIFYDALPNAMDALLTDASPGAQIRASVTYNMIVEGTLAETGYHAYFQMLSDNNLLPGLREGIGYLKRDESRHIAYGIYLLSRLVNAQPALWQTLERQMEQLLAPALEIINELFAAYQPMPFGLQQDTFIDFAMNQFNHRMNRIEKARDTRIVDFNFDQTD